MVDVGDLTLLYPLFPKDAQLVSGLETCLANTITFNLSFFSKALVILEVFWGHYSAGILPRLRPTLRREGIIQYVGNHGSLQ